MTAAQHSPSSTAGGDEPDDPAGAPAESTLAAIPTAAPFAVRPRGYAARSVTDVVALLDGLARQVVPSVTKCRGEFHGRPLWIVPTVAPMWGERVAPPTARNTPRHGARGRTVNLLPGDQEAVVGAVKSLAAPVADLLGSVADRSSLVSAEEVADLWLSALLREYRETPAGSLGIRVVGRRGDFPPLDADVLVTHLVAPTLLWRRRSPIRRSVRSAGLMHWVLLGGAEVLGAGIETFAPRSRRLLSRGRGLS